jgi:putative ubiquitin-RnfH superfamily antitoxin RatB of RatAB toxin-antitoxin module
MPHDAPVILVEVAYALPDRAVIKTLRLPSPATLGDALDLAAADADFSGVDLSQAAVGIFGRAAGREQLLNAGDRIELYRPLAVDPKDARRARAKQTRRKA